MLLLVLLKQMAEKQQYIITVTFPAPSTAATYTYVIEVLDDADGTKDPIATQNFTFTTTTPATSYMGINLGAQSTALPSYFGARNGMTYTSTQAPNNVASVDFLFNEAGTVTADPILISWDYRRAPNLGYTSTPPAGARKTYFKASTLTPAQFLAASNKTVTDLDIDSGDPQFIVIEEGKVYMFETEDGKQGLVHIKSLGAGDATVATDGTATIDVKIQN